MGRKEEMSYSLKTVYGFLESEGEQSPTRDLLENCGISCDEAATSTLQPTPPRDASRIEEMIERVVLEVVSTREVRSPDPTTDNREQNTAGVSLQSGNRSLRDDLALARWREMAGLVPRRK